MNIGYQTRIDCRRSSSSGYYVLFTINIIILFFFFVFLARQSTRPHRSNRIILLHAGRRSPFSRILLKPGGAHVRAKRRQSDNVDIVRKRSELFVSEPADDLEFFTITKIFMYTYGLISIQVGIRLFKGGEGGMGANLDIYFRSHRKFFFFL